jgi:hypothetical protein
MDGSWVTKPLRSYSLCGRGDECPRRREPGHGEACCEPSMEASIHFVRVGRDNQ